MVSRGVKAGQRTQFQFKIKKRPVDGFGGGQLLNSKNFPRMVSRGRRVGQRARRFTRTPITFFPPGKF